MKKIILILFLSTTIANAASEIEGCVNGAKFKELDVMTCPDGVSTVWVFGEGKACHHTYETYKTAYDYWSYIRATTDPTLITIACRDRDDKLKKYKESTATYMSGSEYTNKMAAGCASLNGLDENADPPTTIGSMAPTQNSMAAVKEMISDSPSVMAKDVVGGAANSDVKGSNAEAADVMRSKGGIKADENIAGGGPASKAIYGVAETMRSPTSGVGGLAGNGSVEKAGAAGSVSSENKDGITYESAAKAAALGKSRNGFVVDYGSAGDLKTANFAKTGVEGAFGPGGGLMDDDKYFELAGDDSLFERVHSPFGEFGNKVQLEEASASFKNSMK